MINPFDLPSLWKALRTFSLTFAVVFSSALLGVSVTRLLRKALGELSLPWIFLWLVPMALIGLLAKHEHRIVRNAALRRQIAVALLVGAVSAHIVVSRLQARTAPRETTPAAGRRNSVQPEADPAAKTKEAPNASQEEPSEPVLRHRGPRSK